MLSSLSFVSKTPLVKNAPVSSGPQGTQFVSLFKKPNARSVSPVLANTAQASLFPTSPQRAAFALQATVSSVVDDKCMTGQFNVLFEELESTPRWGKKVDEAGVETISGSISWMNDLQACRFQTESDTLTQPCNPTMAFIADRHEIPFPTGQGVVDFTLELSRHPGGKFTTKAYLSES